jgi:hypothetical protein
LGPSLCRGTFIPSPSLYFVRRTATDILNFSSGAEVSARSSTQPEVLQGNDPHRPRASGGIGHLRLRLQGHTSCQDTHALVHSRTRTCTRTSMHSRERALTRACIHAHIHALTRANMLMRVHRRRNWSTPSKTSGTERFSRQSSSLAVSLMKSISCSGRKSSRARLSNARTASLSSLHIPN